MRLNLSDIDPNGVYDAKDVGKLLGLHYTSVHRQIFPNVTTQKLGRSITTTGAELIRHISGEPKAA